MRRSRMEKIVIGALILTSACRLAAIQIDISEDTTLLEAEKMCISKGQIPRISLNPPSVFCLALNVVKKKKTWEGAMRHCRQSKSSLVSLLSANVTTLAQRNLYQNTTERLWIGLRYLGDRWLWVNDDPLVYDARPHGDKDYQCPLWNRCGALTKGGQWENRKCEERLNFICA